MISSHTRLEAASTRFDAQFTLFWLSWHPHRLFRKGVKTVWLRTLDPPPYVLKPTVFRESFWNHSIKKWSDIISPFILNDNIICFIAFLDVFSTKNGFQKNTKKSGLPDPLPPPYLALSPKF